MFQDWLTEQEWQRQMEAEHAKLKKLAERIKEEEKKLGAGRRLPGWSSQRRYGR